MRIRTIVYISPYVDCEQAVSNSVCRAVIEGIRKAEEKRAKQGLEQSFVSLHSYEYLPNGTEEKAIGIDKAPTVVFFDENRNVALSKLSRRDITEQRVKSTFLYLASLEKAETGEKYVDQNGQEVGEKDLIDMWGTGGWGFGLGLGPMLGGCPKWFPKWLCEFPVWILLLVVILVVLFLFKRK